MKVHNAILGGVILVFTGCHSPETTVVSNELITPAAEEIVTLDSITGLIVTKHFELVKSQCTVCHSAKLITQNRATREGWEQMIRWMQAGQGLWDLGDNEPYILDYLSANYGPKKQGRRLPLSGIEWYELKE